MDRQPADTRRGGRPRSPAQTTAGQAVGLLEVYSLVTAFAAADAACKAANVTIESFDKNKPANAETLEVPLLVLVKLRGTVADIEAAVQAGEKAALSLGGVLSKHIIPRPAADTEEMLKINALAQMSHDT